MGFAGYFLITQDFINKGKEIGVFVGPGRMALIRMPRVSIGRACWATYALMACLLHM